MMYTPPNSAAEGWFGPSSMSWQLYRESFVMLGGLRALLLQVAHPSVADGVARYSAFKTDPFGRGYRTFMAMASIYFGTKQQAESTGQRLKDMHGRIKGKVPEAYTASDPALMLWVFATITDTTFWIFGHLPPKEADWKIRFYEESKTAAALMGIEPYPVDIQAFEQYMQEMMDSNILGSAPVCAEVAQSILRHPRMPARVARLLAPGALPPSLCARLGIERLPGDEEKLQRWLRRAAAIYRHVPGWLRFSPAYHQARYRVARAAGTSAEPVGYLYHHVGKKVPLLLGLPPA